MKVVPAVLVTLAVAAVAAAVVSLTLKQGLRTDPPPAESVVQQRFTERQVVDGVAQPVPKSPTASAGAEDIEDYGAMIDKLLPLAEDGNAKAQYDIYKATTYCQDRVRFYFTSDGHRLTLEQGIAFAVRRKVSCETAQAVHRRCGKFLEMDPRDTPSSAVDWLNASAKQGYAPAQSALAAKILEERLRQGFESASGTAPAATEPLDRTKSANELFSEAVKSRDPEVLFTISEMIPLIHPTASDRVPERFAWMTLACERGFDCSAQAEWVVAGCLSTECQSIKSPSDVVRILVGDRWPEVRAPPANSARASMPADGTNWGSIPAENNWQLPRARYTPRSCWIGYHRIRTDYNSNASTSSAAEQRSGFPPVDNTTRPDGYATCLNSIGRIFGRFFFCACHRS